MNYLRSLVIFSFVVCCLAASGKDKNPAPLPTDVLEARTVLVVVDPDTGVALDSPLANRTAQ